MDVRTLNIGLGIINHCLKDIDDLKALTLAIVLKSMFKSSVVKNFSIRRIIKITGFDYKLAKLALERGTKLGFFTTIENEDHSKELRVAKLWHRNNSRAIRFCAVKFDDGHVNLFFKDGEGKNEILFANEKKVRQTPMDYLYKVMQAAILKTLVNCGKNLELLISDHYTKRGMEKKNLHMDSACNLLRLKRGINKEFNVDVFGNRKKYTGISYDTILGKFITSTNGLNRYKIQKIVKMCEKEGLVQIIHNFVVVDDEMDDKALNGPRAKRTRKNIYKPELHKDGIKAVFEYYRQCGIANDERIEHAYYVMNDQNDIVRDLHKTGFMGKGRDKYKLFMQLGNDYINTCDPIRKRWKTLEEKRRVREHKNQRYQKRRSSLLKAAKEALKNLYTL